MSTKTRRELLKLSKKDLIKKCKKYKLSTKGSRINLVGRLETKLLSSSVNTYTSTSKLLSTPPDKIRMDYHTQLFLSNTSKKKKYIVLTEKESVALYDLSTDKYELIYNLDKYKYNHLWIIFNKKNELHFIVIDDIYNEDDDMNVAVHILNIKTKKWKTKTNKIKNPFGTCFFFGNNGCFYENKKFHLFVSGGSALDKCIIHFELTINDSIQVKTTKVKKFFLNQKTAVKSPVKSFYSEIILQRYDFTVKSIWNIILQILQVIS